MKYLPQSTINQSINHIWEICFIFYDRWSKVCIQVLGLCKMGSNVPFAVKKTGTICWGYDHTRLNKCAQGRIWCAQCVQKGEFDVLFTFINAPSQMKTCVLYIQRGNLETQQYTYRWTEGIESTWCKSCVPLAFCTSTPHLCLLSKHVRNFLPRPESKTLDIKATSWSIMIQCLEA